MRIVAAFIVLVAIPALIFFGLSVLLIEVVGWLWPENAKSQSDRFVVIASARETRKQKEKAAKIS
jgi:hypothetical protein